MKYCPKCGLELVLRPEGGRERPTCPVCGYFSPAEIAAMDRVQTLSKWAIEKALAGREGFVPSQMGTDASRPGWILFGLKT